MKTRVSNSQAEAALRQFARNRNNLRAYKIEVQAVDKNSKVLASEDHYQMDAKFAHSYAAKRCRVGQQNKDIVCRVYENAGGETYVFLAEYKTEVVTVRPTMNERINTVKAQVQDVASGASSQDRFADAARNPKVSVIIRHRMA